MDWLAALDLDNHWWWLIAAVLLGIGEIILPGVFLIWIAIASALTGVIALATGISVPLQFLVFALLCLAATYAGRRWYAGNPVPSQDPLLNDRAARLVGERVTVVEAISGGHGRVKVGDSVWSCRGEDAPTGAIVRVTGAQGTLLIVENL